jgi:hypothetical protein
MIDYIFQNNSKNIDALFDSQVEEMDFSISVMNMKKFYAENDFQLGDSILMRVDDFDKAEISIRYQSSTEMEEKRGEIPKWCALFSDGLEVAIDENGPDLTIHEEIAIALLCNADYLLKNPVIHIGGFLALSSKFTLSEIDGEGIIWFADEAPPRSGDEMDLDDLMDLMEEARTTPPDTDSMDGILKYMGFDFIELEIEAYMRDELFNGGNSSEKVWNRCFDERIDDLPELLEYKQPLQKLFNRMWKSVSDSYDHRADKIRGNIRERFLQIKDQQTEWMRGLDEMVNDPRMLDNDDFMELAQMSNTVTQILLSLNNGDYDISKKEMKQFIRSCDMLSNKIAEIQQSVESRIK